MFKQGVPVPQKDSMLCQAEQGQGYVPPHLWLREHLAFFL